MSSRGNKSSGGGGGKHRPSHGHASRRGISASSTPRQLHPQSSQRGIHRNTGRTTGPDHPHVHTFGRTGGGGGLGLRHDSLRANAPDHISLAQTNPGSAKLAANLHDTFRERGMQDSSMGKDMHDSLSRQQYNPKNEHLNDPTAPFSEPVFRIDNLDMHQNALAAEQLKNERLRAEVEHDYYSQSQNLRNNENGRGLNFPEAPSFQYGRTSTSTNHRQKRHQTGEDYTYLKNQPYADKIRDDAFEEFDGPEETLSDYDRYGKYTSAGAGAGGFGGKDNNDNNFDTNKFKFNNPTEDPISYSQYRSTSQKFRPETDRGTVNWSLIDQAGTNWRKTPEGDQSSIEKANYLQAKEEADKAFVHDRAIAKTEKFYYDSKNFLSPGPRPGSQMVEFWRNYTKHEDHRNRNKNYNEPMQNHLENAHWRMNFAQMLRHSRPRHDPPPDTRHPVFPVEPAYDTLSYSQRREKAAELAHALERSVPRVEHEQAKLYDEKIQLLHGNIDHLAHLQGQVNQLRSQFYQRSGQGHNNYAKSQKAKTNGVLQENPNASFEARLAREIQKDAYDRNLKKNVDRVDAHNTFTRPLSAQSNTNVENNNNNNDEFQIPDHNPITINTFTSESPLPVINYNDVAIAINNTKAKKTKIATKKTKKTSTNTTVPNSTSLRKIKQHTALKSRHVNDVVVPKSMKKKIQKSIEQLQYVDPFEILADLEVEHAQLKQAIDQLKAEEESEGEEGDEEEREGEEGDEKEGVEMKQDDSTNKKKIRSKKLSPEQLALRDQRRAEREQRLIALELKMQRSMEHLQEQLIEMEEINRIIHDQIDDNAETERLVNDPERQAYNAQQAQLRVIQRQRYNEDESHRRELEEQERRRALLRNQQANEGEDDDDNVELFIAPLAGLNDVDLDEELHVGNSTQQVNQNNNVDNNDVDEVPVMPLIFQRDIPTNDNTAIENERLIEQAQLNELRYQLDHPVNPLEMPKKSTKRAVLQQRENMRQLIQQQQRNNNNNTNTSSPVMQSIDAINNMRFVPSSASPKLRHASSSASNSSNTINMTPSRNHSSSSRASPALHAPVITTPYDRNMNKKNTKTLTTPVLGSALQQLNEMVNADREDDFAITRFSTPPTFHLDSDDYIKNDVIKSIRRVSVSGGNVNNNMNNQSTSITLDQNPLLDSTINRKERSTTLPQIVKLNSSSLAQPNSSTSMMMQINNTNNKNNAVNNNNNMGSNGGGVQFQVDEYGVMAPKHNPVVISTSTNPNNQHSNNNSPQIISNKISNYKTNNNGHRSPYIKAALRQELAQNNVHDLAAFDLNVTKPSVSKQQFTTPAPSPQQHPVVEIRPVTMTLDDLDRDNADTDCLEQSRQVFDHNAYEIPGIDPSLVNNVRFTHQPNKPNQISAINDLVERGGDIML